MVIAIGPKCSKTIYTYSNSHIYTRGPTVAQDKFIRPFFLHYDFILCWDAKDETDTWQTAVKKVFENYLFQLGC